MKNSRKPSVERPWLKYYDKQMLENLKVPEYTLNQYLRFKMPGMDIPAINFYGNMITWKTFFENVETTARALKALGFGEGDQVPVFLKSIPEFFFLMLACERVGASLLIRDNEPNENADSLRSSGSKILFANDCLSQEEMNYYLENTQIQKIVLIPLTNSCDKNNLPDYIQKSLDTFYVSECAHGKHVITWSEFLTMGNTYIGVIDAPVNIDRPLFCCYTSGSTGPSKQVIHSAHTIIGALVQMDFYGSVSNFRPTWLVTVLPPCLVSVVIAFLLLPIASNKLLLLDPFCDYRDIDLEIMRLRPNCWPSIPMFWDAVVNSTRIPKDYDISYLYSCGAGCEHMNNTQIRNVQQFLLDHNCHTRFTTGYGSSEAGSNVSFHLTDHPMGNGNVGAPMPLTNVAICKPGTTEELTYNMTGEICLNSPNVMLGYDNPEATAKALRLHDDGKIWLHTGDVGYMNEDGILFTKSRGSSKHFGGGFLDILPMENALADAQIQGIRDQFFANIPDIHHDGYYLPYLFIVLEKGYSLKDIHDKIIDAMSKYQIPDKIEVLPERPFWHFKTYRISMIRKALKEFEQLSSSTAYPSNMF